MAKYNRERLIQQLKKDEGFSAKAYWDNKQWTVGYGTRAKSKHEVIVRAEAEKRLGYFVDEAANDFDILFKGHEDKFNEVRTEAMLNLIFNIGITSMRGFKKTLAAIRNNKEVDWNEVATHLEHSLWYKQVGNRAKRIVEEIRTGKKVVPINVAKTQSSGGKS